MPSMSVSYETIRVRSLAWLREHKPEWPFAWTRDIRVDPHECVVDDNGGHLWALPFSTDGSGTIAFGPEVRAVAPLQLRRGPALVAASRVVASFAREPELSVDEDGLLPRHLSLLTDVQRGELRARLRVGA